MRSKWLGLGGVLLCGFILLSLPGIARGGGFIIEPTPGGNNLEVAPWDDPATYTIEIQNNDSTAAYIIDGHIGRNESIYPEEQNLMLKFLGFVKSISVIKIQGSWK